MVYNRQLLLWQKEEVPICSKVKVTIMMREIISGVKCIVITTTRIASILGAGGNRALGSAGIIAGESISIAIAPMHLAQLILCANMGANTTICKFANLYDIRRRAA